MKDTKSNVKEVVKGFTKECVSEIIKDSTKQLLNNLDNKKRSELKRLLENKSPEEIDRFFLQNREFNEVVQNTIHSTKDASIDAIQSNFEKTFTKNFLSHASGFEQALHIIKQMIWKNSIALVFIAIAVVLVIALTDFISFEPPQAPVPDDGIEGWSNNNAPTFRWSFSDYENSISGYYFRVDDEPEIQTDSTSVTLPPQPDGTHTFYVRAEDNDGHIGPYGSHEFNIDTAKPPAPENLFAGTSTIAWSEPYDAGGIAGYYYSIDGGNEIWTAAASIPKPRLSEGEHTFYVLAEDNAGNKGGRSDIAFALDTEPQAPAPDDGVRWWSNDNTPTFNWNIPADAGGIEGYYYKIDDGPESRLTSTSVTLPPQPDGTHTFYVRAEDNEGNIGPYGSHEFKLDTAEPPAPEKVFAGTSNIAWSEPYDAGGIAGYYYSVDGGNEIWTAATSIPKPQLSEGKHTFYVLAEDNAGNRGGRSYIALVVDTTPPYAPSPDDGVRWWSNDKTPTFNWNIPADSGSIKGYYYKIDDGPESRLTSTSVTLPPQPDGTQTFYVRAEDNEGNIGPYGSHEFNIDTAEPPAPEKLFVGTSTIAWSEPYDAGGIAGYYYSIDGGNEIWTAATSIPKPQLSEGKHTFYVLAEDNAGNRGGRSDIEFVIIK